MNRAHDSLPSRRVSSTAWSNPGATFVPTRAEYPTNAARRYAVGSPVIRQTISLCPKTLSPAKSSVLAIPE